MLDMGFVNDIKKILKKVPEERQTLFFSATMPKSIRKFSNTILNRPKEINVTPVSSTAETIQQSVYCIPLHHFQFYQPNLPTNLMRPNLYCCNHAAPRHCDDALQFA